jgi:hypothetical protein
MMGLRTMHPHLTQFLPVLIGLALVELSPAQQIHPTTNSTPSSADRSEVAGALKQAARRDAETDGLGVLYTQLLHSKNQSTGWVVLLGRKTEQRQGERTFPQVSDVTLRLYEEQAGRFRSLSREGPLDDPRFGHDPAASATLECVDLNGDGTEEVIVHQTRPGASWIPSCAIVFKFTPESLVRVGTVTSHYPIQLSPLIDRNEFVLPATYAIGKTLAHYAQPRWTDYYAFDGKQLRLANELCPEHYRACPRELEDLLVEHGNDAELWYFLGKAHQVLGHNKEAKPAFEKANSLGYKAPDWKVLRAGVIPAIENQTRRLSK